MSKKIKVVETTPPEAVTDWPAATAVSPSPAGRPRGSRNEARLLTTELPAACPACGSTRRERLRAAAIETLLYEGELPDGRRYNRVEWHNTKCLDCGQHLTVRTYRLIPICDPEAETISPPSAE